MIPKDAAALPDQIRPLAERLEAELVRDWPWTSRPAFQWARASWAFAEAQCLLLEAWIDGHGTAGAESERAVRMLRQLRPLAKKLRAGLVSSSPSGRCTFTFANARVMAYLFPEARSHERTRERSSLESLGIPP